jgi:hypothetical protein
MQRDLYSFEQKGWASSFEFDNIEDVKYCVQGAANPEVQWGAARPLLHGTGMPEEATVATIESWFLPKEQM